MYSAWDRHRFSIVTEQEAIEDHIYWILDYEETTQADYWSLEDEHKEELNALKAQLQKIITPRIGWCFLVDLEPEKAEQLETEHFKKHQAEILAIQKRINELQ